MALSKITLTDVDHNRTITAMFNPKEYSISKSVVWTSLNAKGLDIPAIQFDTGQRRELSLELFFDTYSKQGAKKSVKPDVKKIEDLMKIDNTLHRPPIVLVSWGSGKSTDSGLNFKCVLEQIEQRYTMFTNEGTPVRAIINATFREIDPNNNGVKGYKGEKQSPDHTKVRTLKEGDTLQHLAYVEYDDPALWKILAETNSIEDPLNIPPGTMIKIPPL
jgi:nucleoid-associated protein YgaU